MTIEEIKNTIRVFLSKYLEESKLEDDTDLFSSGLVNSLFAMQLVLFVEKNFAIVVGNRDLDFENFTTLNAISALVYRKLDM